MKVLIIDDDQTMVNLLKTLLQIEGFNVDSFDLSLETTPETILAGKPDAIVMDVHLKYMNGTDLLKQLRALTHGKGIFVIMTSGLDRKSESMAAGADLFLQKPYMPQDLVAALRNSEK
jgi:DNA-binding response OmpR family regulator